MQLPNLSFFCFSFFIIIQIAANVKKQNLLFVSLFVFLQFCAHTSYKGLCGLVEFFFSISSVVVLFISMLFIIANLIQINIKIDYDFNVKKKANFNVKKFEKL